MTAKEIIQLICDKSLEVCQIEDNEGTDEFGQIETSHQKGGCEGGGDYAERVFLFKDHNIYLKVTGFYSSYHGTDWEYDWTEVFPKEKTITVYE